MTFIEARNALISLLNAHLGIKFVLSDDVEPEESVPYAYYSVITPGAMLPGTGNITREIRPNHTNPTQFDSFAVNCNLPIMHLSMTFCSLNRTGEDGKFLSGEDEAVTLMETARDYLDHVGYRDISRAGLVVVELSNFGQRSGLVVEEIDRRYGFDVRIRYSEQSERNDLSVSTITITRSENNA
jgi:hypothetical protein